jgi:hypothetical protein
MHALYALPVLVVLAVLLLAGCAGDRAAAEAPGDSARAAAPSEAIPLAFAALAAPRATTLWANGTVALQDTCNTGGCIADTSRAIRPTDLSTHLPIGVPVTVRLELAYAPHAVLADGFDLWLQSDGSVFYSYLYDGQAGLRTVEAVILPRGRTEAVMAAFGPGDGLPDSPYTFRIDIEAHPTLLPPGVPVGIPLEPGQSIAAQGTGVDVLLYGPDDALVGQFREPFTLPAAARRGEYTVLLSGGSAALVVGNVSAAPAMRLLGLAFEMGPETALAPHGTTSASWDVAGFPLGVGVRVYNVVGGTGQSSLVSVGFEVRMAGPNGWSATTGTMCGFCLTFGEFSTGLSSGLGNPGITAGTYVVEGESTLTHEVRVTPFAVRLDRTS